MSEKSHISAPMPSPPGVATRILDLCVPANIRQHLIGDLHEEYQQERLAESGQLRADLWYWKQTLLCSYEFLNKQQGGIMAFLFSVLFFVAMMVLIVLMSANESAFFINIPSFMVIFPTAFVIGIGVTSFKSMKLSFKLLISEQDDVTRKDIVLACKYLNVSGVCSMYLGYIGTVVGAVAIAASIDADTFSKIIGPATAVGLLTLLYGLFFKILCYAAEQKIQIRYLDEHE